MTPKFSRHHRQEQSRRFGLQGYQWGEEIPIGLFWRRTDLETLEEQELVLHTGEGPLAFRSNLAIPSEQAKALINELL